MIWITRRPRIHYPSGSPFNGEQHSWTYDAIGNRLTSTVNGVTQSYAYQKLGSNPSNWQRLASDGTSSYTYDSNGNTTTRGSDSFGWNFDNRISTTAGSSNSSYVYDYLGRRSSKTVNAVSTNYLYNGLNIVAEVSGGVSTYNLVGPGVDDLMVTSRAGSLAYHSVDGLGSVAASTDLAGVIENSYTYDAWGVRRSSSETFPQAFGYTGREKADSSDQWFYRARVLAPSVGRFLSEDPKRFSAGINFYSYVSSRPIQYTDPLGFQSMNRPGAPVDLPVPRNCTSSGYQYIPPPDVSDLGARNRWYLQHEGELAIVGQVDGEEGDVTLWCICLYSFDARIHNYERHERYKREVTCCPGGTYTEYAFSTQSFERREPVIYDPREVRRVPVPYTFTGGCLCPTTIFTN